MIFFFLRWHFIELFWNFILLFNNSDNSFFSDINFQCHFCLPPPYHVVTILTAPEGVISPWPRPTYSDNVTFLSRPLAVKIDFFRNLEHLGFKRYSTTKKCFWSNLSGLLVAWWSLGFWKRWKCVLWESWWVDWSLWCGASKKNRVGNSWLKIKYN